MIKFHYIKYFFRNSSLCKFRKIIPRFRLIKAISIFIILLLISTACNRQDLWENNYTIPDVTVTSASSGTNSIVFSWIDPIITEMNAIHITCTDVASSIVVHTYNAGKGVQTHTVSGLAASLEYNINIRITDNYGKSSPGVNFRIVTNSVTAHFIYSVDDLNAVRGSVLPEYAGWGLGDTYNLMADLDLNVAPYNTGEGWVPIGEPAPDAFTGVFEGNGHTIRNLYINRSTNCIGLFGYVNGGTISNINLINVSVTGASYVGGLIGYYNNGGPISACSMSGTVTGISNYIGGLLGAIDNGSITSSNATANVTGGGMDIGGLIGQNYGATIDYCYSICNVTATGTSGMQIGGLVGNNTDIITGSYARGTVTATGTNINRVGGLVGNFAYATMIIDSYADVNVTGTGTSTGGLIGYLVNNDTFTLIIDNCHAIGNVTSSGDATGGLIGYCYNNINGGITFQNNCYATGTVSGTSNAGGLIGLIDNADVGTITLQDCHTSGSVDGSGGRTGGLLGRCSNSTAGPGVNGTITLNNCSHTTGAVTGNSNTGGLIGSAYNNNNIAAITLNNCYATSAVKGATEIGGLIGSSVNDSTTVIAIKLNYCSHTTGIVDGVGNTGGLVGFSQTTLFDHCSASGTVTGNGQYTGGLIGQNIDNMGSNSVVYCSSSCLVYGYDNYTGGLIGMNESAMINHSNATGYVSINIASFAPGNAYAGGLIGYNNNSTISNSYAECNVDAYFNTSMAGAHNVYTGGLIGYNTMGIEESHAIGIVTTEIDGSDTKIVYSGGLVGRNYSDITRCYFDGEVRADNGTPSNIYAGGLVGYYTGVVTISQCFSDGVVRANIAANLAAGGLVGYNENIINNSYSLCDIQAAGDCAGGFVGYNGGAIMNCYSAGPVSSASSNHGGFCGFDDGGTYTSCYYDEDYSGQSDTGRGDPVGHTFMLEQSTYAGWDFPPPTGATWLINPLYNGGYPYLCYNWPY